MSKVTGRGATANVTSRRFNLPEREDDGDWLDQQQCVDGRQPKPRTTVGIITSKKIITYNQSPDVPFDRSINAYAGCEHGCIYCFARPTHAYHDLSPGLDFETRLFAKPDAARLLRETLAKPNYKPAPVAMGTNTDPYQPIEGRYEITRQVLEVCLETRHPVTITTKSDRVLRDLDLLTQMAARNLIAVGISITSMDAQLSGLLEPRASSPAKRMAALGKLAEAGIPAHVSVAPVIPAITDEFIEAILTEAAARGVRHATWIIVRLPHEVAPLFREWLDTHFPDRAGKVMATIRDIRGGRDNDPDFFSRMRPSGVWADLFRKRFRIAANRLGMTGPHAYRGSGDYKSDSFDAGYYDPGHLDCSQFRRPNIDGQLQLL